MRMRTKGKWRIVATGEQQFWPLTREEAFAERAAKFWPPKGERPCWAPEKHGPRSVIWTISDRHNCCAIEFAHEVYQLAKQQGLPTDPGMATAAGSDHYWSSTPGRYCGHEGKTRLDGTCWICHNEKEMRKLRKVTTAQERPASPRQRAIASGEKWYMPAEGDLCKNGHHALRRVDNGQCSECVGTTPHIGASPRQIALAAGEKWYMPAPGDLCKNGHHALRRVDNGHCSECPGCIGLTPRETRIDKLCPDMVVSREDAIAFGFNIYRTGEPCGKGHTGWRYVSTRACLDCMGR